MLPQHGVSLRRGLVLHDQPHSCYGAAPGTSVSQPWYRSPRGSTSLRLAAFHPRGPRLDQYQPLPRRFLRFHSYFDADYAYYFVYFIRIIPRFATLCAIARRPRYADDSSRG